MNGLSLRIVRGGIKKSKNLIGFPPVHVGNSSLNIQGENQVFESFINASSTDEQLTILKKILLENANNLNGQLFDFLAIVFLLAEVKHPVKCFITRHITKTGHLQNPFSAALADLIKSCSVQKPTSYVEYLDVVSKLCACLENFPAGATALRIACVELAGYLVPCLECCMNALNEQTRLSPTEKNEVFNLAHLALRLLLHIVQKGGNDGKLDFIYNDTKSFIKQLIFHEDVPMDTKSLSGILFLTLYIVERGPDSWVDIFKEHSEFTNLLNNAAGALSLYSAVVTVIEEERLLKYTVCGKPAVLVLTERLTDIGERNSHDAPFTLGVTRALVAVSKGRRGEPAGALLRLAWPLLQHHLDSVRHLARTMLENGVRYCVDSRREGNPEPLNNLLAAVSSLDKRQKSYYVALTLLVQSLGAEELTRRFLGVADQLIAALGHQAVQASATLALETIMQQHIKETDPETIYKSWILPILQRVSGGEADCTVLNLLHNLLSRAVAVDGLLQHILPHIQGCTPNASSSELQCVLTLLLAVKKSRVALESRTGTKRGLLHYDVLTRAHTDVNDQTRILALSLIAESPKSTEWLEREELWLVLLQLRHEARAAPAHRQRLQAPLRKFMKRLEDSYRVIKKHKEECHRTEYYKNFVEELRELCYSNLLVGANYSRRSLSLQILKWTEYMDLAGYERRWCSQYVERLLLHLEDSYEVNKALALDILRRCPIQLLQNGNYSVSLNVEDILKEASSMKPTDCMSAAYKLELLRTTLPDNILNGRQCTASEPASHELARILLLRLHSELDIAQKSIVKAARDGPMYGLLHCIRHLMRNIDTEAISDCSLWRQVVTDTIEVSVCACAAAAGVVNNSSPEGHLPMDGGQIGVGDHGNSGGIVLEDGRPVTAQMVLLCAWRSVKEVSLLLGTLSSRLQICPPGDPAPSCGSISCGQLTAIGDHFTTLLAHTKHRGAFEQAYVGFTELLARLWRSRYPELHNLPQKWLSELISSIEAGDRKDATRRSAGLPFMIQALVTTEVQVRGNPKCFHRCMGTLLRLAGPQSYRHETRDPDTAIHCLNVLRALYRNSALDDSVASYVGDGFVVALNGFEGDTWAIRNASTLMFSALMSRVFGPAHGHRDQMTGRIFFLRYPRLYDFMMEKLSPSESTVRPTLFPVLVLLSRLCPSSLEGSESALRLSALLRRAAAAARSPVGRARALAARAAVPLVTPVVYYNHIEALLTSIQEPTTHNYTHGVLLQLTRLLEANPDNVTMQNEEALSEKLFAATWVLTQANGNLPNYVLADEFLKVFNLVMWRLPTLITPEIISTTTNALESLLFNTKSFPITFGREICLSNAMYSLIIISTKYKQRDITTIICNNSIHQNYDVTLAVLNYLLILHDNLHVECKFQEHLQTLKDEDVLSKLRVEPKYIPTLCGIFENSKYLECVQKSLKILSLERHTQKCILRIKTGIEDLSDEITVRKLFDLVENEHENLTHIYLECLSTFVSEKLRENKMSMELILDVVRVFFACCTPDNGEEVRKVVVNFLAGNFDVLVKMADGWSEENEFEYKATLWSTTVALLEDDDTYIRQRISSALSVYLDLPATVPTRVAMLLRTSLAKCEGSVDRVALMVVLALLDFKSEVCMTDEINDECRVFDQNERHNIILEETVWTDDCAERIRHIHKKNTLNYVLDICDNPTYKHTIDKLCNNNVVMFKKLAAGDGVSKSAALNPKIELFIKKLTL